MISFHFIWSPDFTRVTGLLMGTPGAGDLRIVTEPALVAEAAAANGEVSVYDDACAA
ncbi:hypothetical protein [Nesterenkonia suensis]